MAAFTTAAALAAALGYQVYAGQKQAKLQKQGLAAQEREQTNAENRALRSDRQASIAENRAQQRAPDLGVLLGDQQAPKPGPTGIDADRLLLGRPGLLGR